MIRHACGNLIVATPAEWKDVTAEIGDEGAPFTLARPAGVGALQFSLARYKAGPLPQITLGDLQVLLSDFAGSKNLGEGFERSQATGALLRVAASFRFDEQFLRVWYCSDGTDVVLITYICDSGLEQTELADCEGIVEGMRFKKCD